MTLHERLRRYYVESGANYVQEAADALEAKDERIRELEGALRDAYAFIDSHVADPDITSEMKAKFARMLDSRDKVALK